MQMSIMPLLQQRAKNPIQPPSFKELFWLFMTRKKIEVMTMKWGAQNLLLASCYSKIFSGNNGLYYTERNANFCQLMPCAQILALATRRDEKSSCFDQSQGEDDGNLAWRQRTLQMTLHLCFEWKHPQPFCIPLFICLLVLSLQILTKVQA